MSDRYTFSDHPPQPEGWPREAKSPRNTIGGDPVNLSEADIRKMENEQIGPPSWFKPEGWPADYDAKEEPMQLHHGEAVYESALDVLLTGHSYTEAVRLAEMIRKRVMGK